MPDPHNAADLPASWRTGASQALPIPAGKARAIARTVRERRRLKVLAMATLAEDKLREVGLTADVLEQFDLTWWRKLAAAAGHPCRGVSPETRALVVEKVTRDMSEPYRAKGRY